MLEDLQALIVSDDVSGLSAARQDAIATIRGLTGTRMYPDLLEETAQLPALVYQQISDAPELTQDGDSGLQRPRVQIDVYSYKSVERNTIGDALFVVLQGYSGIMNPTGSPQSGTTVNVLRCENQINQYEPARKQYRRMMDFIILHN